jgi:acylphosphatase
MSTDKTRVHVMISGRVQGVYFRVETQAQAQRTGVTGWVRNTRDRRVEAVFEGGSQDVEEMLRWCWRGSPGAVVKNVETVPEAYQGEFDSFSIRY